MGLDHFCAGQHMRAMEFAKRYTALIDRIVALCPAPDKFAHMCAGLAIWLLVAIAFRRKLSTFAPLIAVVLFEGANEYLDYLGRGGVHWRDTAEDVIATLFWPLVIMLAMRMRPAIRG